MILPNRLFALLALAALGGAVAGAHAALTQLKSELVAQVGAATSGVPLGGSAAAIRPVPTTSATQKAEAKSAAEKTQALPWNSLSLAQQAALKPLAAHWAGISTAQKRKWLEVSRSFPTLGVPEQSKMHSRMAEWVTLSGPQRAQARLNFAQAQQLTPEEKQAKWKAYQALPPADRQRLAESGVSKAGAAVAVKPVPAHKLAMVPTQRPINTASAANAKQHAPKIAAAPHEADSNALLPQPAPAAAPEQPR